MNHLGNRGILPVLTEREVREGGPVRLWERIDLAADRTAHLLLSPDRLLHQVTSGRVNLRQTRPGAADTVAILAAMTNQPAPQAPFTRLKIRSSALVFCGDDVALIRRDRADSVHYTTIGGNVEGPEPLPDALCRELAEELRLDVGECRPCLDNRQRTARETVTAADDVQGAAGRLFGRRHQS